ncbi:copper resistance protein B [Hydrogenimonas sp. SS33]|uniref:copper resistance protein B n=1 Tax=Hydrogenimonas leucolamina TaxID=2954236 RepID=UPI00336BF98A
MKKILISTMLAASLFAEMNDDPLRATLLADRLEWQATDGDPVAWDVAAYAGYDIDKLYFYSEGSTQSDETESENELLYSRAVTPFWDLQGGLEMDTAGSERKYWGILAIQGLAPYFIDTRIRLKISDEAVGVNFDFEYEALLTQRLILTPRIEMEAYSADVPELGIGSGFSSLAMGLRLRYEIVREFAPYVGVEYVNGFGDTKKVYGMKEDARFVAGVRFWF